MTHKNYTRNSDLTYYEKYPKKTNCGSYALRLNEWYHLNAYFTEKMDRSLDSWIEEKKEEGYSNYEISCLYGDILTEVLLERFEGELELCDGSLPKTNDIELVAFNTFCYYDMEGFIDSDFHFKVFRDGIWKEKCGTERVRICNEFYWGDYIGDPIYFYHKIK